MGEVLDAIAVGEHVDHGAGDEVEAPDEFLGGDAGEGFGEGADEAADDDAELGFEFGREGFVLLGEGAAEEFVEEALGEFGFADLGDEGAGEGVDDDFEGDGLVAVGFLGLVEAEEAFLVDGGDVAGEHDGEEAVAGAEVVVDGGDVGFGEFGDVADGDGVEATIGEEGFGGFDQAELGLAHLNVCLVHAPDFSESPRVVKQMIESIISLKRWLRGLGERSFDFSV